MKNSFILALIALIIPFAACGQTVSGKAARKNLVVKEWNTDASGHNKVLDHVTTYNADGFKVEEIEYGSSGQKWRKRFERGANGKVSKESVYDEHNRLVSVKKIVYNELGKKKTQYTYNNKGKLVTVKTFEYLVEESD